MFSTSLTHLPPAKYTSCPQASSSNPCFQLFSSIHHHIHKPAHRRKSKRRIDPSIPQTVQRRVYDKRGPSLRIKCTTHLSVLSNHNQESKSPSPVNKNHQNRSPQKIAHHKWHAKTPSSPGDLPTTPPQPFTKYQQPAHQRRKEVNGV